MKLFRPDMKMLEVPEYVLLEIHEFGERRLGMEEKPLLGKKLSWQYLKMLNLCYSPTQLAQR